ncbi:Lipid phosphate phosphatase [Lachnellula suecica]|uniref:Lipid phosphate phosphatase n=1 Tax=Lachnellula suecica TaxID=602035 RepID=A0A8T9CIS9_9HELO|nr:Lipid phosphate phosphatase [Lachnellula suecica]
MGVEKEHNTPAHIPRGTAPVNFSPHLRTILVDYSSILILALVTVGIWTAPVYYADNRLVPLWLSASSGSFHNSKYFLRPPIEMEYPWRQEPLPSWSCGFVVVCVPLMVVVAFQIRTRNLWEFHTGIVGVLKAAVANTFVVMILKQFIGGFRPNFIEVCQPDMSLAFKEIGKERYWLNVTACTGVPYEIKKAMQTFPSGHAANSFAGATFISLYLNAKLKVFADHASSMSALLVTIAPLIGATLVSGSMYISYQHHAVDIVFGIIIGLSLGILTYRSRYTAVFDFRYNHIPLPPHALNAGISNTLLYATKAVESRGSEEDIANGDDVPVGGVVVQEWRGEQK